MGINALNRTHEELFPAIWYSRANIAEDGTASEGKHIKVRMISDRQRSLTQPVSNLITEEKETKVSTRFHYDYQKLDELWFLGKRWLITELANDYANIGGMAIGFATPTLQVNTVLTLKEQGEIKAWGQAR